MTTQGDEAPTTRHERLQNEYQKVMLSHAQTMMNAPEDYDDTEFMNRMFKKDADYLHKDKHEAKPSTEIKKPITKPLQILKSNPGVQQSY